MKKILMILVMLLLSGNNVYALPENVQEMYDASGAQEILSVDNSFFESNAPDKIIEKLSTGEGFAVSSVFDEIVAFLLKTLKRNVGLCFTVIATGYIVGLYSNIQSGVGGKGVSECGFIISYCVFAGILTIAFSGISDTALEITENLSVMVKSLMPILISLLITSGGVVSGSLLSSVLIGIANVVLLVVENLVAPLIYCSFGMSVAGNMSDKIRLTKSVSFLHKIIKWVLLFVMAAFGSLFGIYGLSGTTMDATTGKLVRFAIGSGVPLVGGIAADSFESVLATLVVSKNLIGVTGVVVILVVLLGPVLETTVMMWIFRLCTVIMEPFSDGRIIRLLTDTSECISMLFAVLISVGLIFIGGVGVILVVGNFTMG
ncbi:MAG: stage III sporulation protein AE [Clostridia bacterium]|nr:stage III sporulation protein AE [Clostridia bacterium]